MNASKSAELIKHLIELYESGQDLKPAIESAFDGCRVVEMGFILLIAQIEYHSIRPLEEGETEYSMDVGSGLSMRPRTKFIGERSKEDHLAIMEVINEELFQVQQSKLEVIREAKEKEWAEIAARKQAAWEAMTPEEQMAAKRAEALKSDKWIASKSGRLD